MHDIITAVDGEPTKLNLGYATAQRYRTETAQKLSEQIAATWKPPSVANLHWDGKLMQTLDASSTTERLPILLSGIGGTKLLGVPAIPSKSSEVLASLLLQHLASLYRHGTAEILW